MSEKFRLLFKYIAYIVSYLVLFVCILIPCTLVFLWLIEMNDPYKYRGGSDGGFGLISLLLKSLCFGIICTCGASPWILWLAQIRLQSFRRSKQKRKPKTL